MMRDNAFAARCVSSAYGGVRTLTLALLLSLLSGLIHSQEITTELSSEEGLRWRAGLQPGDETRMVVSGEAQLLVERPRFGAEWIMNPERALPLALVAGPVTTAGGLAELLSPLAGSPFSARWDQPAGLRLDASLSPGQTVGAGVALGRGGVPGSIAGLALGRQDEWIAGIVGALRLRAFASEILLVTARPGPQLVAESDPPWFDAHVRSFRRHALLVRGEVAGSTASLSMSQVFSAADTNLPGVAARALLRLDVASWSTAGLLAQARTTGFRDLDGSEPAERARAAARIGFHLGTVTAQGDAELTFGDGDEYYRSLTFAPWDLVQTGEAYGIALLLESPLSVRIELDAGHEETEQWTISSGISASIAAGPLRIRPAFSLDRDDRWRLRLPLVLEPREPEGNPAPGIDWLASTTLLFDASGEWELQGAVRVHAERSAVATAPE